MGSKISGYQDLGAKPGNNDWVLIELSTGQYRKVKYSDFVSQIGLAVTTANGTHSQLANTNEQDVIEITTNLDRTEISFDMSLLLQDTTIRVYEKVDGTTYELKSTALFPTDFPANKENVDVELVGKNRDQKITFQSGTAEAGSINVPWARRNEVSS